MIDSLPCFWLQWTMNSVNIFKIAMDESGCLCNIAVLLFLVTRMKV
jgi:hypothetical protein